MLKLGWQHVSTLPWYVKISRPAYIVRKKFTVKGVRSVPAEIPEDCRFTLSKLDEIRFDSPTSSLLQTQRTPEYYNWRFIKHPVFSYGIESLNIGGRRIACIYFTSRFQSHLELFIVDVIGDPEIVPQLVRAISKLGRRLNISATYCLDNNGLMSNTNLLKFGYLQLKNKNFVCLPLTPDLEDKALVIKNWQITGAMHDTL